MYEVHAALARVGLRHHGENEIRLVRESASRQAMTRLLQLVAVRTRQREQHADDDANKDQGDRGRTGPW